MHASLKTKIALIAVGVMLFSMGAIIASSGYFFTREYTQALESRSLAIGKSMKVQIERLLQLTFGIRVDDLIGFNQQCQDIVNAHEGIRYAMVVGPAGNVVFHNEPSRVGAQVSDPALRAGIASRAETMVRHDDGGKAVYSAVVPVFRGGDQYAASVVVGFDAQLVTAKVSKMLALDAAVGLFFFLAGTVVLLIALSAFVTRPLASLVHAIEGLPVDTPGEARRVVVRTRDEIGTLAATFNAMTDKLAETVDGLNEQIAERRRAEAELTRHRDHLEDLVKERTAQLRVEKERAEVANRTKSAFLAGMSHELRTPLNGILGYAQILARETGLSALQSKGLGIIRHSGEHLLSLINDILDLSRVEAGRLDLHPAVVAFSPFLRVIADSMRVKAEEKGLQFAFAASADLPITVMADETRLRQVLLNLLGNAVKFTDRGEVLLRVNRLPSSDGGARIRFEIEDTGPGIAAEHLHAIFLPFEQVGDVRMRAGGTGLGLAISRQLVRLMGDDVRVDSTPGHGSLFWFELVLPLAQAQPAIAGDERAIVGYAGERRRVLVVDDIAENRSVLVDLLRAIGFDMHEAADGQHGLEQAATLRPHLIMMDNVMPVMDGLEATRRLRALPGTRHVPVIAISASASTGDEQKCLAAGADAFLPKPIDVDQLLRRIGDLLQLSWIRAP